MNSEVTDAPSRDTENTPRGRRSLVRLAILVITVYLLQKGLIEVIGTWAPEGNLLKVCIIIQQTVGILAPVALFVMLLQLPVRAAVGLYRPRWHRLVIAVAAGFLLISIINLLLPQIIQPSPGYTSATGSIAAYDDLPGLLLTLATVSIVAAAADEFFFRGVVLRGLMARYGKLAAILVTAILTAVFHTLEPFKLTHSFIMGVVFASSVIWTGSVYTSFILHGLHNSLALLPITWITAWQGALISLLGID
jgi:membrane protease YdiL (CAAX protease family)